MTQDHLIYVEDIHTNVAKHYRGSALMTAVHISTCLSKGESHEEIAQDFDNNLELVYVWIDYIIALNWVHRNVNDGSWIASDDGKSG